jgi:hypothetical protein
MIPIAEKLGGTVLQQQQQPTSNSRESSSSSTRLWNHAVIPPETNLSDTSLEDILEVVTGGYVKNCGPLNAICQEANFYQLWTREYVQHLGDYLLQRSRQHKETIILDIGAGDGALVQCLKDYMKRKATQRTPKQSKGTKSKKSLMGASNLPTIVATDDMSWGIFTKAKVEKLTVEQALEKYTNTVRLYDQVIVLCSWMPMGQDWTSLFRDAAVDEYILIGEADDGSCGHNWLTFGNPAFMDEASKSELSHSQITPPYEDDGYQRWDMDVLTPFQFSSFDCAVSKSSKTVSFRKTGKKSMA